MDHEAYETQMFDTINHHSGDKDGKPKVKIPKVAIVTKKDTSALKMGLKRMAIALFTAALFASSVFSFIFTATATGYWAVVLFLAAIVQLVWAVIFLYAQGITREESKGEKR